MENKQSPGVPPPAYSRSLMKDRETTKVEKRRRERRIIDALRLSVTCPDCGAAKHQECKPEYGCDDLTRAEEALRWSHNKEFTN